MVQLYAVCVCDVIAGYNDISFHLVGFETMQFIPHLISRKIRDLASV